MPKRTSFKQSYTVNGVGFQSATSGKRGTENGRFAGARRGFTSVGDNGAKAGSYGGRLIARAQQYRDVRAGLGLAAG